MFGAPAQSTQLNNSNGDVVVTQCPEGTISSLHFGPLGTNQSLLLATAWSKDAAIWEISQNGLTVGKARVTYTAPFLCSSWQTNDPSRVFLGSCDGTVKVWALATSTLTNVGQHAGGVKDVFFSTELNMLVTGSWDRTIKFWDTRSPTAAGTTQLSERLYAMDVKGAVLVAATAEKKLSIYDLRKPTQPFRAPFESPLKSQSRSISLFPDSTGFAIGSIEGRVGIQHVHERDKDKNFAFKCHRENNDVYAVNAITFHQQFGTFATVGSDGTYVFWDKDSKQRLKLFNKVNNAVTAAAFSQTNNLFAYSVGYDWSKGIEYYDRLKQPNAILIHQLKEDEIKKKAGK